MKRILSSPVRIFACLLILALPLLNIGSAFGHGYGNFHAGAVGTCSGYHASYHAPAAVYVQPAASYGYNYASYGYQPSYQASYQTAPLLVPSATAYTTTQQTYTPQPAAAPLQVSPPPALADTAPAQQPQVCTCQPAPTPLPAAAIVQPQAAQTTTVQVQPAAAQVQTYQQTNYQPQVLAATTYQQSYNYVPLAANVGYSQPTVLALDTGQHYYRQSYHQNFAAVVPIQRFSRFAEVAPIRTFAAAVPLIGSGHTQANNISVGALTAQTAVAGGANIRQFGLFNRVGDNVKIKAKNKIR